MSKRSLNLAGGKALYALVTDPASVPVSFLYGGKAYRGLGELPIIRKEASDHTFKAVFALDEAVELTLDAAFNREYGEVEYTMQYKRVKGAPFMWVYVDYDTLQRVAAECGWRAERIAEGEHYDYLARITRV